MFSPAALTAPQLSDRDAWRAALALVLALSALRLAVLFLSPVQLYPDEAQYWVWSRALDWGYFSKPPMIAWLIGLTTAIGGQAEPWVRVSSIFLHAAATLALFDVGRRLYSPRTGLLGAVLYALMPGVQLSAGVASTDAPLLFFLSAALWAYVRLVQAAAGRSCVVWGGLMGAFLGLAFLSKYAAAYFVAGLVLHALISAEARRAWRPRALLAATAATLLLLGPNLGWNARNHFATIGHTAQNADWNATSFFHPLELLQFLTSQMGVFGPVPFVALVLGGAHMLRRRKDAAWPECPDSLLMCLVIPPLAAVSVQALLSRANANWAFAAYGPGSVLAAAWLISWRARRWTQAGLTLQAGLAVLFLAIAVRPALADQLGLANSLKRSRGWEEIARAVLDRAATEPGLTAIGVDSRFLYNEMRYYGRDRLAGVPPLRMWVRENRPQNHAEMSAALEPDPSARVLAVSLTPKFGREFRQDFAAIEPRPPVRTPLDRRRTRDAEIFVGRAFMPRPRDQVSGEPTPP